MKKFLVEVDEMDEGHYGEYSEHENLDDAMREANKQYHDLNVPVRVIQVRYEIQNEMVTDTAYYD